MKKNVLVKQVLGTDSVKPNPTTEVMVHTWNDRMDENSLPVAKTETKSKKQPIDEFRYMGRCFCGTY